MISMLFAWGRAWGKKQHNAMLFNPPTPWMKCTFHHDISSNAQSLHIVDGCWRVSFNRIFKPLSQSIRLNHASFLGATINSHAFFLHSMTHMIAFSDSRLNRNDWRGVFRSCAIFPIRATIWAFSFSNKLRSSSILIEIISSSCLDFSDCSWCSACRCKRKSLLLSFLAADVCLWWANVSLACDSFLCINVRTTKTETKE